MAADIASEVLQTGEGLPYVGPLCTAIQRIIELINVSKYVRDVCMEEFPAELRWMQANLKTLPDSIGVLSGEAKTSCDSRLKQLGERLDDMENIIITFKTKGVISRIFGAKADKERIDNLRQAIATAKQDVTLVQVMANGMKLDALGASVQGVTNLKQLDQEYNDTVYNGMKKLESYEKRMGNRYATALILPPILVSPEEREEIFELMRTMGVFWRGIQQHYKNRTDVFVGNNHWLQRGINYRTLVEPLDIANWYFRGKNLRDGHYIDGIPEHDELVDNHKRPGRYILLQQKQKDFFGGIPVSSLQTARELKDILRDNSWETNVEEQKR